MKRILFSLLAIGTLFSQSAYSQYVEARISQPVRGSLSLSLNRVLNLDRYVGYEIDTIEVRGSADRRYVDVAAFYNRREIGRTSLQRPYIENAVIYAQPTVIRRGQELRLDARGEGYIESVAVYFRGGNNPNPPYPYPGDQYVQVTCSSLIKPIITSCRLDRMISDVRIVRQISNAECRYGDSWWYDSTSISVTKGCRATFEARVR